MKYQDKIKNLERILFPGMDVRLLVYLLTLATIIEDSFILLLYYPG